MVLTETRLAPSIIEWPRLQSMNGVADVHGQVDRRDLLPGLQIIQANRRRRRTAGYESVTDRAKAAAEALSRDVRFVETGKFDVSFIISHDLECDIIAIAASIANAVVFRVVEQESVAIRAGVVGAGWQRADF